RTLFLLHPCLGFVAGFGRAMEGGPPGGTAVKRPNAIRSTPSAHFHPLRAFTRSTGQRSLDAHGSANALVSCPARERCTLLGTRNHPSAFLTTGRGACAGACRPCLVVQRWGWHGGAVVIRTAFGRACGRPAVPITGHRGPVSRC